MSLLISEKVDFKTMSTTKDKHSIIIKGLIYKEDTTVMIVEDQTT